MRTIEMQITQLNRLAVKSAPSLVFSAYKYGLAVTVASASDLGVVGSISMGNVIHTQSVAILADQIARDLLIVNGEISKHTRRLVRSMQKSVLEERLVNEAISKGLILGESRRTISEKILSEITADLYEGKLVLAGGRRYDPGYYVSTVTRTRMREAQTQGTINSALQLGMDLIQVDVHGDACPVCRTRMGRVYSISGVDPNFPKLDARTPFHPNCRCNMFPITVEGLKAHGEYDTIKELSNRSIKTLNYRKATQWLAKNKTKDIRNLSDLKKGGWIKSRRSTAPTKELIAKAGIL